MRQGLLPFVTTLLAPHRPCQFVLSSLQEVCRGQAVSRKGVISTRMTDSCQETSPGVRLVTGLSFISSPCTLPKGHDLPEGHDREHLAIVHVRWTTEEDVHKDVNER